MKERIGELLETIVLFGVILAVILRSVISFWLLLYVDDVSNYSQIVEAEINSNQIIEVIIFVSFVFLVVKQCLQKRPFQFNLFLDGPLIGLIAISLVSFIYTINYEISFQAFLELTSHICLFYMVSIIACEKKLYKGLMVLLILIATAISLYGIRQYFVIFPFLESSEMLKGVEGLGKNMVTLGRVGSVFGWPNKLAGFLGISIPITIGFVFAYFSKRKQYSIVIQFLVLIAVFASLLSMFFTYSLGGWLSLLLALVIEVLLIIKILGAEKIKEFFLYRKIVLSVALICISALFIVLIDSTVKKRDNELTSSSFAARKAYTKWTLQIIKDNPLVGVGIGNFRTAYMKHVPSGPDYTKHAHNSYLEIWSEIGIGGISLFLIFVFQLLRKGLLFLNSITSREDKFLIVGLFSGVCAFLIHNIMEFTFYAPSVALYWWFAVGLLVSRRTKI